MKRLTFDLLLAGTVAFAPMAWAHEPASSAGEPGASSRVHGTPPPAETPPSTTTGSERAGNQPGEDRPGGGAKEAGGDLGLVQRMHAANEKELEMAYAAADKALSPKVKSFARTLITDHKAMDRQLLTYARKKGLAAQLGQASTTATTAGNAFGDSDMQVRLRGETGREFDQDFLASMIDEHDRAIELALSSRDAARDPQLRDIFDLALPKLEKHRKMAQDLLNTSSTGG